MNLYSCQVYLLFCLLCLVSDAVSGDDTDQHMCDDLVASKRIILVIGMLTQRMMLISYSASDPHNQYYGYDLTPQQLSPTQLSLSGGFGVQTHWPVLYQMLQQYNFPLDEVATLQDAQHEYIYLALPHNGLAFDLVAQQRVNFTGAKEINLRWISALEMMSFYGIGMYDGLTSICKYKFVSDTSTQPAVYDIKPVTPTYLMCINEKQQLKLVKSVSECAFRQNWKISNGFSDQQRFYLFQSNSGVLIFDLSVITSQVGQFVDITSTSLDKFISCASEPPPTQSTQSSTAFTGKSATAEHHSTSFSIATGTGSNHTTANGSVSVTAGPVNHHTTEDNSRSPLVMVAVIMVITIVVVSVTAAVCAFCCRRTSNAENKIPNYANAPLDNAKTDKAEKCKGNAGLPYKQAVQNVLNTKTTKNMSSSKNANKGSGKKAKRGTTANVSASNRNTQGNTHNNSINASKKRNTQKRSKK